MVELARAASHIWIAKGKNLTHFDMKKDNPNDEQLASAMLGPTGNLRAPTIRRGKRLFVGFNEQMYRDHLTG